MSAEANRSRGTVMQEIRLVLAGVETLVQFRSVGAVFERA